jgi:hypothetical protein
MTEERSSDGTPEQLGAGMSRRQTRMPDGRYLLYYTFGAESATDAESQPGTAYGEDEPSGSGESRDDIEESDVWTQMESAFGRVGGHGRTPTGAHVSTAGRFLSFMPDPAGGIPDRDSREQLRHRRVW